MCMNEGFAHRFCCLSPLPPSSLLLGCLSCCSWLYTLIPCPVFASLQWGRYQVPVSPGFPWASRPLLEVPRPDHLHFALRPAPGDHLGRLRDGGQEALAAQRHRGCHHRAVLRPSQEEQEDHQDADARGRPLCRLLVSLKLLRRPPLQPDHPHQQRPLLRLSLACDEQHLLQPLHLLLAQRQFPIGAEGFAPHLQKTSWPRRAEASLRAPFLPAGLARKRHLQKVAGLSRPALGLQHPIRKDRYLCSGADSSRELNGGPGVSRRTSILAGARKGGRCGALHGGCGSSKPGCVRGSMKELHLRCRLMVIIHSPGREGRKLLPGRSSLFVLVALTSDLAAGRDSLHVHCCYLHDWVFLLLGWCVYFVFKC